MQSRRVSHQRGGGADKEAIVQHRVPASVGFGLSPDIAIQLEIPRRPAGPCGYAGAPWLMSQSGSLPWADR